MSKPTIQDIEQYDGDFLPTALVAAFIESDPGSLIAGVKAGYVEWACVVGKSRVKIPKQAFLHWYYYGKPQLLSALI